MRPRLFDRAAQFFNCADHVRIGDLEHLVRAIPGGIERGPLAGVQALHRGQRPMRHRAIGHGGDHQRCIAKRHHDLTALAIGAVTPKCSGFQPLILRKRGHTALLLVSCLAQTTRRRKPAQRFPANAWVA